MDQLYLLSIDVMRLFENFILIAMQFNFQPIMYILICADLVANDRMLSGLLFEQYQLFTHFDFTEVADQLLFYPALQSRISKWHTCTCSLLTAIPGTRIGWEIVTGPSSWNNSQGLGI